MAGVYYTVWGAETAKKNTGFAARQAGWKAETGVQAPTERHRETAITRPGWQPQGWSL